MHDHENKQVIDIKALTIDEVNLILRGLDTQPHGQVRQLIDKLMAQAMSQLNQPAGGAV